MAKKIPNPIPDPVLKPHKAMEFDLPDEEEVQEKTSEEPAVLQAIDPEDDFDIKISEEDDFDI